MPVLGENMTDKFTFRLDWAAHTLLQLVSHHQFDNVLDIGSGEGEHKRFLEFFGKKVFSVDKVKTADYLGDFLEVDAQVSNRQAVVYLLRFGDGRANVAKV